MKKKLLTMSVVALLASMMFGTVALASDNEDVATDTDAVIEVVADEDTTEIEVAEDAVEVEVEAVEEVTEDVEENEIEVNKGWVQKGSSWYYYNDQGVKVTGWKSINSKWYYFDASGVMQTGWLATGGYWYCFRDDGTMRTGWYKEDGYWHYFNADGQLQTGWLQIGTAWYHFTKGGKMQTGWQAISGSWYYFDSEGKMCTGWKQIDGSWYYFNGGEMISSGIYKIKGVFYKFNKNGTLYTGWYKENKTISGQTVTCWYYFDSNGLAKGWKKISGYWYYFNTTTNIMVSGCSMKIDGTLCFFKKDGRYEGTNSADNHCQVDKVSRDYRDYDYGDVWIKVIDAYYNGKNQIVLDAVVANRAGGKITLDDCYLVVYDYKGNIIAQQTFNRSDFSCANNTVKDISFTFNTSKVVDLRYGADVDTSCYYYLYY